MKQKIVLVRNEYFDEFISSIQKSIDEHATYYNVQQINYFNMDDRDLDCFAFILFSPLSKEGEEWKI